MPDNNEKRYDNSSLTGIDRRSALRRIGVGAISLSLLGGGTVAAEEAERKRRNADVDETRGQEDRTDVEPQVMHSFSTVFDPYEIGTSEDSTLISEWQFQAVPPIPGNYYQLDIVVNADHIYSPETQSTNIGGITKDWVYDLTSPVGAAYHWQAKVWVADLVGATRYVHADINALNSGEVEAKTGTFWPAQSWSTGYLEIS